MRYQLTQVLFGFQKIWITWVTACKPNNCLLCRKTIHTSFYTISSFLAKTVLPRSAMIARTVLGKQWQNINSVLLCLISINVFLEIKSRGEHPYSMRKTAWFMLHKGTIKTYSCSFSHLSQLALCYILWMAPLLAHDASRLK